MAGWLHHAVPVLSALGLAVQAAGSHFNRILKQGLLGVLCSGFALLFDDPKNGCANLIDAILMCLRTAEAPALRCIEPRPTLNRLQLVHVCCTRRHSRVAHG